MTSAVEIVGSDRPSRWVVTCDHASNRVPQEVNNGDLGLPEADMSRHIAYDIGAKGLSEGLGQALDAPVALSRFSRLVIDPNRGPLDPTLLMKLYDGTIIPTNRDAGPEECARRLFLYHHPFHAALGQLMERPNPVLLSVHSFTPKLRGRRPRPWQIGVLSASDRRLADPLLSWLRSDPGFGAWVQDISGAPLCVGDNAPYAGHLPGDTVDRHALHAEHPNVLLELRNDLIATPEQQAEWAKRLAPLLQAALADSGL